jgi:hypothetical protein
MPHRRQFIPDRFDANRVAGCYLWLQGERINQSDSTAVVGWRDRSPAGNHLTQATAGRQGSYKLGVTAGRPAFLGDGADDNVNTVAANLVAAATAFTVFVVCKTPAAFGTKAFFQIGGSGSTGGRVLRLTAGGVLEFLKANIASMGTSSTALSASTPYVLAFAYSSPNGTFYVNGAADGTLSSAQTFSNPAAELYVGAQDDAGVTPTNAHIFDLVLYERLLNDGERAYVTRGLGAASQIQVR